MSRTIQNSAQSNSVMTSLLHRDRVDVNDAELSSLSVAGFQNTLSDGPRTDSTPSASSNQSSKDDHLFFRSFEKMDEKCLNTTLTALQLGEGSTHYYTFLAMGRMFCELALRNASRRIESVLYSSRFDRNWIFITGKRPPEISILQGVEMSIVRGRINALHQLLGDSTINSINSLRNFF